MNLKKEGEKIVREKKSSRIGPMTQLQGLRVSFMKAQGQVEAEIKAL